MEIYITQMKVTVTLFICRFSVEFESVYIHVTNHLQIVVKPPRVKPYIYKYRCGHPQTHLKLGVSISSHRVM